VETPGGRLKSPGRSGTVGRFGAVGKMGEVGRLGAVGRVGLWMDCAEEDREVSVKASAMATQMGVRVSFMGSPLVLRIREGLWSVVQRIRMVYGERPRVCGDTGGVGT